MRRLSAILDLSCVCWDDRIRTFGGICHSAKSGWNCSCSFEDMWVSILYQFGFKMPIYARLFFLGGGHIPPNDVTHRPNPKRTILGLNHVIWAINREYRSRGSSWACEREKGRTGQEKSQKGYILPICGEAPTEAMYMKSCLIARDVLDLITCAREISKWNFHGLRFYRGRIFHFPIDFWMGLQQCMCHCSGILSVWPHEY